MTLPGLITDMVEVAQAALLVGSVLAIFSVAAAVSEILDRFDPFDDDSQEDAA